MRPRGWHLPERHLLRRRRAGRRRALDFGFTSSTTRARLLDRGSGPVLLPAQDGVATWRRGCGTTCSSSPRTRSGSTRGTIKATVLIETIPAAFEMDEILYELRDHSARAQRRPLGLHLLDDQVLPRRGPSSCCPTATQVTMTVPFMRAYTELLVKTCHRARRARDGRHGGGHPEPRPTRRPTSGDGEASRERQGARGGRRLRRHLGRPPRLGRRRHGGVRRGARRAAQPGRPPARRRRRHRRAELLDVAVDAGGEITRGGPAQRRQRRHPVHLVVAARQRRGRRSTG